MLLKTGSLWPAKGTQKVTKPYFCRNRVPIEMCILLGSDCYHSEILPKYVRHIEKISKSCSP